MARDSQLLSCIAALGVRDHLLDRGIDTGIKLPNDVWTGGRKICGLLIENILDGKSVRESIIGVGLNVNQESWPGDLPNPVSMKQISGKEYDLREELARLRDCIGRRAAMIGSDEGRRCLMEEFDNNTIIR